MKEKIVEILIEKGKELFRRPYKEVEFFLNKNKVKKMVSEREMEKANSFLNDLKNFPHAFVLACLMNRQIPAERAWLIPHKISNEIGGFQFPKVLSLKLPQIQQLFRRKNLHRFNDIMANNFYSAIQKIHIDYNDDVSNVWKNKPRSAAVVRRFLEFDGVGIKISTMTANILARDFKIPMEDYFCIDISPDVHVKRVFKRMGFISRNSSNEELIYCARELNPEYPGIFDLSAWEIGRNWCHPRKPDCKSCYLNKYCPGVIK